MQVKIEEEEDITQHQPAVGIKNPKGGNKNERKKIPPTPFIPFQCSAYIHTEIIM